MSIATPSTCVSSAENYELGERLQDLADKLDTYHNLRALVLLLSEDGKHGCNWPTWQRVCTLGLLHKLIEVAPSFDESKPDVQLTELGREIVKYIGPRTWQYRSLNEIASLEYERACFWVEKPGVRDSIGTIYERSDTELIVRLLNAHEAKLARTYRDVE